MPEDLLVVFAEGKAKPGREEELRQRLMKLLEPTRAESGCVQYDMHESIDEPGRFIFFERWKSRDDLDLHLKTAHLQEFFKVADDLVDGGVNIRLFRKSG